MLIVHHLRKSQSERIPWLCEELGIPYDLKLYDRLPTGLAPEEYKSLHPYGTAPVISDEDTVVAESGAVMEYILRKLGRGKLQVAESDSNFADYLFWFHFANGSVMAYIMVNLVAQSMQAATPSPVSGIFAEREARSYRLMDDRLSKVPFLAGDSFTAADIINFYPLTTNRLFTPRDFSAYPSLRAYLRRIGGRPAYIRAMQRCEPGMALNLD